MFLLGNEIARYLGYGENFKICTSISENVTLTISTWIGYSGRNKGME